MKTNFMTYKMMNVDFSRTFSLGHAPSYLASFAVVNPSHFYPDGPHNRSTSRRTKKTHRTPEIVKDGMLRMSNMTYPLQTPYALLINPPKHRLLEWAKQSHIQSLVYALPTTDNKLTLEYWIHDHSVSGEYRLEQEIEMIWGTDTITISIADYSCIVPIHLLEDAHQCILNNLIPLREKTGWDDTTLLHHATNLTGISNAILRRKLYSQGMQ